MNVERDFNESNLDENNVIARLAFVVHGTSTFDSSMLTKHTISDDGVIETGELVKVHDVIDALDSYNNKSVSLEILPSNVLAVSNDFIVWYQNERSQKIIVNSDGLTIKLPRLIFIAMNTELYVFAAPNRCRPTADTRLYHCPLPNIFANGSLCKGTVKLPSCHVKNISEYEKEFFTSRFTHANHSNVMKFKKGDKNTRTSFMYWLKHKSKTQNKIKMSELCYFGSTLGDMIKKLKR